MKDIYVILDNIIEQLDDVMKQNGWSVKKLANELKINYRTVDSWFLKQRVPKIDYIWAIADYLGVSIDYLVGREN